MKTDEQQRCSSPRVFVSLSSVCFLLASLPSSYPVSNDFLSFFSNLWFNLHNGLAHEAAQLLPLLCCLLTACPAALRLSMTTILLILTSGLDLRPRSLRGATDYVAAVLLCCLLCCCGPGSSRQDCKDSLIEDVSECDFHSRRVVTWRFEQEGSSSSSSCQLLPSGKETIDCDHVAWSSGERFWYLVFF